MKKMTCNQLGGACDLVFEAETFEEIAEMSKAHGTEMFKKGDQAHLDAMNKMKDMAKKPGAMQSWFVEKRRLFDAL